MAKRKEVEVIKIKDGEKIDKPGIYDMSIEWYHSDCCIGPSISSSGLRALLPFQEGGPKGACPAMYWAHSYLNPNRIQEDEKDHFKLGQAAHMLLLGETGFTRKFAIRPETIRDPKDGEVKWHANRTVCKMWVSEQESLGRRVLKPEEVEIIRQMARSLTADEIMNTGILTGDVERTLIWQDEKTGIWVKVRPDALPPSGEVVTDIKTIENSDWNSCFKSIRDLGYGMQMALIGEGIKQVLGRVIPDDGYILVFVGKKRPCLVNVKPLEAMWLQSGRIRNRRALDLFAECWDSNHWPTYSDSGETLRVPDFMRKEMELEIKNAQGKA